MTDYSWLEPIERRTREVRAETQRIREETTKDIQQSNGDFLKNYPEVTRVEVVTNNGREYVENECSNVQVSLQDDGKTIKIFLKQELGKDGYEEVSIEELLK